MAFPTAVNSQITDIVQQHKDKAREVVDLIKDGKYDDAILALEQMTDPEFGLRPTRDEID